MPDLCHLSFSEEGTQRHLGSIEAVVVPAVGDLVSVPLTVDAYEVVRRQFTYPSPGSVSYNQGGRSPSVELLMRRSAYMFVLPVGDEDEEGAG